MKTHIKSLALVGLVTLFSTATTLANDNTTNTSNRTPNNILGWIASPKATLEVCTHKKNNYLVVQVKNNARQAISVGLYTTDGLELGFYPIGKRQEAHAVRFDVSELTDASYVVKVRNRHETITKTVTLVTPPQPSRQAIIAIAD
ncbi:hypothetical protein [Spirosoma montaniterrae]|uniref:Secretion system C-terminal sorting domain-containing protein n=1 Tax=Spirosoma montaniterrae TaxID=1178516 RepID=A0A1P9WY05_9BACT|nr:hypothetical protein [Spirosoma montaniterrae]AQG80272.1 hypothetical protein AWR27_13665 [Spirosoma montaniterrae]